MKKRLQKMKLKKRKPRKTKRVQTRKNLKFPKRREWTGSTVRCTRQSVPIVGRNAKFLSSHLEGDQSTAGIVIESMYLKEGTSSSLIKIKKQLEDAIEIGIRIAVALRTT
jgi:hypothetical protein